MTYSVSVVLCCYNSPFVIAQLESIADQDLQPAQVVVVNDSSDPAMRPLIESVVADLRARCEGISFVVLHNETNIGMYASYERALQHAQGDFIATCDHDDVWTPVKLSTVIPLLAASGASGIAHDVSIFFGDGQPPLSANGFLGPSDGQRLSEVSGWRHHNRFDGKLVPIEVCLRRNRFSGTGLVFRRELMPQLLPFPRDVFPDHWIVLVASGSQGLLWCDKSLVHYRRHDSNSVSLGSNLRSSMARLDQALPSISDATVSRLAATSAPGAQRALAGWPLLLAWRQAVRQRTGRKLAARRVATHPLALLLYPSLRPLCGDVIRLVKSVDVRRHRRAPGAERTVSQRS